MAAGRRSALHIQQHKLKARAGCTPRGRPSETENRPPGIKVRGGLDRSCLSSCRRGVFVLHVGLETRRSAVAARLQTAAFAWRCGSLHAGLARPWNATVGEPGQRAGTGCLLSPQTSRLSKRLRPQHPSAAIRNAPGHRLPRRAAIAPEGIVTSAASRRALRQKGSRPRVTGPDDRKGDDPALRRRRRQLALCHESGSLAPLPVRAWIGLDSTLGEQQLAQCFRDPPPPVRNCLAHSKLPFQTTLHIRN